MKSIRIIILTTLFSFLLSAISLHAEDKFRTGYIITNTKDTVRGYLQQYNINAFTKCNFKKSLDDKITEYLPGDIFAYRYDDDGKFFISKEAPLEGGNRIFFLEYLIQGKANVYFMRDISDHFFIETEKNKIIELSQNPILIHKEDGTMYYKESTFKGKIRYMLSDCPDMIPEINKSELQMNDMIKIAKDYHNRVCNSEQCTIYELKIKPMKVCFYVVGGIAINQFTIENSYSNYNPGSLLGCKIDFENLFFSSEQSSFQLGLIFQQYVNYTFYTKRQSYYSTDIITDKLGKSNFNTTALKIPITYNYTFSQGKFRPYIGGGINNIIVLSRNKDFTMLPYYSTDGVSNALGDQVGLIGMAGYKYMLNKKHILNLELSYEYSISTNIADNFYKLHNSNFSLVLGYSL
jgi:hypothetical protein